jgi:hypothetical protein
MTNRMLWALLTIVVGGLQALDSGVLHAGGRAQLLAALGVAVPAAALASTEKWHVWVGGVIAAAILLVWARMVSAVPLNAIHIGLFVPAMYVFFVCRLERKIAG